MTPSLFLMAPLIIPSLAHAQDVKVEAGPMSGVSYLEAKNDFNKPWRGSQYERGSVGNSVEVVFSAPSIQLDLSRVDFNQNPADPHNQLNSDGTRNQEEFWTIRLNSPDLSLGKLKHGIEYGVNFQSMAESHRNKWVQDIDHRGIDVSRPIEDDFMNSSLAVYLKKEWKPTISWSNRLDLAVKAALEISPLGASSVFRDHDLEHFEPANEVSAQAMSMRGKFSISTLLKIKNKAGDVRWVLAVSVLQDHSEAVDGSMISYDHLAMGMNVDYRVNKRIALGLKLQEDKESTASSAVITKYYQVYNVAALTAKISLAR